MYRYDLTPLRSTPMGLRQTLTIQERAATGEWFPSPEGHHPSLRPADVVILLLRHYFTIVQGYASAEANAAITPVVTGFEILLELKQPRSLTPQQVAGYLEEST